jgi:ABC-type glycerol-3-phosphate transport system permease component
MFLQILCAYPLSKRNYQGRGILMTVFFVTTMVGAGLIPTFMVRKSMGMINNVWAVLLAGAMSVHNMIILRTSFRSSIPGELYDAAAIDGANDFQTLVKIALPLCKATLSVLTLYSAVGCWNEYFTSMVYNQGRPDLMPLQFVLRPYMKASQNVAQQGITAADMLQAESGVQGITFSLIVITTVPVLVMYFVVQKYFEKGVMVGSVKG